MEAKSFGSNFHSGLRGYEIHLHFIQTFLFNLKLSNVTLLQMKLFHPKSAFKRTKNQLFKLNAEFVLIAQLSIHLFCSFVILLQPLAHQHVKMVENACRTTHASVRKLSVASNVNSALMFVLRRKSISTVHTAARVIMMRFVAN